MSRKNTLSEIGVGVGVETFSPDDARAILSADGENYRQLNERRAKRLAEIISAGYWRVNGETIKFGPLGELLDGQHRLRACVLSGVPIQTLVVRGLADTDEIDRGTPRNIIDALRLRGESDAGALASAARTIWKWEASRIADKGYTASVTELLRTVSRHPGLRDALRYCSANRTILRLTTMAACHYLFRFVDRANADTFVDSINEGRGLEASDPVLRLRMALIADAKCRSRMPQEMRLALTIKAWNAFHEGRAVPSLRWVRFGAKAEKFPAINGLTVQSVHDAVGGDEVR